MYIFMVMEFYKSALFDEEAFMKKCAVRVLPKNNLDMSEEDSLPKSVNMYDIAQKLVLRIEQVLENDKYPHYPAFM